MSDEAAIIDLSEEQLWSLSNGKEIRLHTADSKIKLRGENYYD